jgi:hypothetical protein
MIVVKNCFGIMACILMFQGTGMNFTLSYISVLKFKVFSCHVMPCTCRILQCRLTSLESVESHGNEEYHQVRSSFPWSFPHYSFH